VLGAPVRQGRAKGKGKGKGTGNRDHRTPEEQQAASAQSKFQALADIGVQRGLFAKGEGTIWAFRVGKFTELPQPTVESDISLLRGMVSSYWLANRTKKYKYLGTVTASGDPMPASEALDAATFAGVRIHLQRLVDSGVSMTSDGVVTSFAAGFDPLAAGAAPIVMPEVAAATAAGVPRGVAMTQAPGDGPGRPKRGRAN